MKNLTRVLALVLTFAMMISTVAMAASFTDIEAGSTYAEATTVLADLGIINGYTDGTFGPEKAITRAEAVAVINRLQGLSDAAKAAGGKSQYTDVKADAWYAGDVNLATQMGIVAGNGNGLFRPEDQVKYEEAVKMVVAALGYNQEYVMRRGGWPTGYLVIATENEISKGLSVAAGEPAYRGIVAKLVYNALTAPTFAFKEYSTDGKAVYEQNKTKITLEEKLQAYKLTGYVQANAITALAGSVTDNDKVNFKITDDKVGKAVAAWTKGTVESFLVGETDIATTLGFATDIYVAENEDGEYEIVSYTVNNVKNKAVVIEDPSVISAVYAPQYPSVINGAAGDFISIYDDEVDTTNTTYDLDANAKLIVNGQLQGALAGANATKAMYNINGATGTDLGLIWAPNYGTVTLLDNNNDGAADFVFVESYVVSVVDDVIDTTNSKKIYTKNSEVIDLFNHIDGKTGFTYSITLDGAEATLADLQENDVIAVAMTQNKKAYDIVAVRKTVAGLVSETDKAVANAISADDEFVVDGVAYKAANLDVLATTGLDAVKVGDEVTFYLDAFNNVAFTEKTSSASKNYGFIVSAGKDVSVGDETFQVRLLDKEGNIATYNLAEKVRYAAAGANGVVTANTAAANVYAAIDALKGANWNPLTANNATNIEAYAKRVVTYKLNANGDINEIVFASNRANGKESYLTFAGALDIKANATFNAKTATFIGARSVDENTVVFNLPMTANVVKEDFKVESIASLSHEEQYDIAFLSVDEDNVAGLVIVVNNASSVTKGSNLAVVKKVMAAQNAEYEDIYNITFVQGGEEKTLATTAEVAQLGAPAVGTVFEYAVNEDGAIKAIGFGGAYLDTAAVAAAYPTNFVFNGGKEQYVYGTVYAKTNNRVVALGTAQDTHAIPADANFILVDLTKVKNNVSVSSFAEFREYKEEVAGNPATLIADNDYTVFMKYYNDEITDVVIYKGANALNLGK